MGRILKGAEYGGLDSGVGGTRLSYTGSNCGIAMNFGPGVGGLIFPEEYQSTLTEENVAIGSIHGKVYGFGGGLSVELNQQMGGLELTGDISFIAGGSFTLGYSPTNGFYGTTNSYATVEYSVGVGLLGYAAGAGVGVTLDEGQLVGAGYVDFGAGGLSANIHSNAQTSTDHLRDTVKQNQAKWERNAALGLKDSQIGPDGRSGIGNSSSKQTANDPGGYGLGPGAQFGGNSNGYGSSVYHDPIIDAAKRYTAGTTYQDTIMRAAATYHPPAQPLAHPISLTPPPRPPSLSYGLPVTSAAINNLPYSLGAPVSTPVQAPVYVPHYAPATSPFPHAKPAGLGGGGLLNNVGNGLGRALGAIFDPIAAALDSVFHPNGYKGPSKPEPTSHYSASEGNRQKADKNHDGKLDSKEEKDFKSKEEDRFKEDRADRRQNKDHDAGVKPILLDLDGNGVKVDELTRSTRFLDAGGDGLLHRTAWAGAGDGVLFFDADGDEKISQKREYVFTEWDPTASSDMEALRAYFDTNGDGKLTAADAAFAQFRVMVTNADGTSTVKTLAQLGVTEINLTEDATRIQLADGSVIEGQTTFKKSDGSTGTVASTALAAEADGNRVTEVVSTDANGNRVVVSTAYDAGGQILYAIRSVTTPTGANVTNSYDDDGDGVTDRIQTIDTVTNGNGSKTETIVNKTGAVAATAIQTSRVVTTRSVDGKSVVIDRDSTGGGWFDQHEVRTINADGSRTRVMSDLGQSGAVIRSVSETISADGRTRSTGVDEDGNGAADVTTAHAITVAGDNSRTEVTNLTNQNGSLRSSQTESVSANGRVKTINNDLDGNGTVDRIEQETISVTAGATSSTITTRNGDNSLRRTETHSQSADALSKTTARDVDGDGDNDLTTADVTVVNADTSRVNTVTMTNVDGSIRGMTKETLGADKVTSQTWVDQNQDGTFQATDLVRDVVVTAGTLVRTETVWDRNADGSVMAKDVIVTSADGLSITTTEDADGDGDTDSVTTDVKLVSGGVSTRTVTTNNQNGSLRGKLIDTTSADGLTETVDRDVDGNGTNDSRSVDARILNANGSTTRTVSSYAGDGTTLTGKEITDQSADRRTTTVSTDANGDGANDRVLSSVEATDGSKTVTVTDYFANGVVRDSSVTSVSANGLVSTTQTDINGDALIDVKQTSTTVLNADGSRSTTQSTQNGNNSLRSQTVSTVSDDRLTTTVQTDADGDGAYERVVQSVDVLNANGSVTGTVQTRAQNNALLTQSERTVSDDGLVATTSVDRDGNGTFDLTSTDTTVLQNNGGTIGTVELRDAANVLRSRTVTTISDDQRYVTTNLDVNGDGQNDVVKARSVVDAGTVTNERWDLSATGALQAYQSVTTSDDGLVSTSKIDQDGNGINERVTDDTTTLNADGSSTREIVSKGANGSIYGQTSIITSDDGFATTRTDDFNHDGTSDLTTTSTTSWTSAGVTTQTVQHRAANNAVLDTDTVVTSADKRTTTETFDADGNGTADRVTQTTIASNGTVTSSMNLRSSGGAVEATIVRTISGDGLTRTSAVDRNADGRVDLATKSVTAVAADGSATTTTEYTNDRYVLLGRSQTYVRDDGLVKETKIDLNGDGLYERRTEENSFYEADGDIYRTQVTSDATGSAIATVNTWASGNGLQSSVWLDYTGDENFDRSTLHLENSDGSSTNTLSLFGAGYRLAYSSTKWTSADQRIVTTDTDLNGDGRRDRQVVDYTDLDRDQITTWKDYNPDGTIDSRITAEESANGMLSSYHFEIDGLSGNEFRRETVTSFGADGSRIETFSETYGNGTLAYRETTTSAADGLSSTRTIDTDGDGNVDGTNVVQTVLNADGSRRTTDTTTYADGSLRAKFITDTSADGRRVTSTDDYDGNGIADKKTQIVINADQSRTVTETALNQGGLAGQTFVTTTTADGLFTEILRAGVRQTITRSPVDNGSYVWNNGVTAAVGQTQIIVAHQVDAIGIETWTAVSNWFVSGNATMQTSTAQVSLDGVAKAKILQEAARIYDAVLDRDIDITELETLVSKITDGRLDKPGLTTTLIGSGEFSTRYGTLTHAEFIGQIYLNTYGRAPSLTELDTGIRALAGATQTRAQIALDLAESAEHLVAGNGHMATNNFDVIISPAAYERSLDKAYVQSIVKTLFDAAYDRDATSYELNYFTQLLLKGTANPDDIAATLLAASGEIQGISSKSLLGLTGAALVQQAFLNAFGRQATASELDAWTNNLSAARLTTAQFVASLAQSVEHKIAGNIHIANILPVISTISGDGAANTLAGTANQDELLGFAGADTLAGGAGADNLTGGTGSDSLDGGAGNDIYRWSKGDGNDTINDTGTSASETDTLVLNNVASWEVSITRVNGTSGLSISIPGPSGTETVTVVNRYSSTTSGAGIEAITFSDGITWSLTDILSKTIGYGTTGADSLIGADYADVILGGAGSDTIIGNLGDDSLTGGTGSDTLWGGATTGTPATNGNDSYFWSKGDGSDLINDWSQSLTEVDTLVLSNVLSSEVSLAYSKAAGNDLLITIVPTGEVITIDERYQNTTFGYGIEVITFSDGVSWSLADILARARLNGGATADTLIGSGYADNIFGLAGNDTLVGADGDDSLTGGTGNDLLWGGGNSPTSVFPKNGNHTYFWSKGDGNDEIRDWAQSLTEVDTLVLTDVLSTEVSLAYSKVAGNDLLITIVPTGEVITIDERYQNAAFGYGIEAITFSDGVIWNLDDILNRARLSGSGANETLTGSTYRDNIYGLAGNDSLVGGAGDDLLVGGSGADTLDGGAGNDRYEWSLGDGNDSLSDTSTVVTEVDSLALLNVASTGAVLTKSGTNLVITINSSGEVITVKDRFLTAASGNGVEVIAFSDGVTTKVLDSPVATATINGTTAANTLTGWNYRDLILADAGNDTLSGLDGDDTLNGGLGVDSLVGGNGNDQYLWTRGDGNDTINDTATSLTEIDKLIFSNVVASDVSLSRAVGSNDLKITVAGVSGSETITIVNRFANTAQGTGIEVIEFSDGRIWTLEDILAATSVTVGNGTGNDSITGTGYADNLFGLAGSDTLVGGVGDDWLNGGTGIDSLDGGTGNDSYSWSKGDGSDTINDTGTSTAETDTLSFANVISSEVVLTRANGSNDLIITVLETSGNDTLTVKGRFTGTGSGLGIEAIDFANGELYRLADIIAATAVNGTTGADSITGSSYRDNLFGFAGADTLVGNDGDDVLVGGTGNDSLVGGNGNDTYRWALSDGSDVINDAGQAYGEVDTLELTNVASTDVWLTRFNGSTDIKINFTGSSEVLTVSNQMLTTIADNGIDAIKFSDGVIWSREQIIMMTGAIGTNGNDTVAGTSFDDILYGLLGNDSVSGAAGDDKLVGGAGADTLDGGANVDTASYWQSATGVKVSLLNTGAQVGNVGGEEVGDVFIGIERLEGSQYGDDLTGDNNSNDLFGLDGNDLMSANDGTDLIYGGAGNDTLRGGTGADVVDGGTGVDWAYYDTAVLGINVSLLTGLGSSGEAAGDALVSIENLMGSAFNDTLSGDDGGNTILAGGGNDTVYDRLGNDLIDLGDGNDSVYVGGGADTLSGGNGTDLISYANSTGGVTVNLATNAVSGGYAAGDSISGFENLEGSGFGDSLTGSSGDNVITTLGGNDVVHDGLGNDVIDLGDGNDFVVVEGGADTFYGGNGVDTIYYTDSTGAVSVDLLTNVLSGGWAADDIIFDFENVEGSSVGTDVLKGTDSSNVIRGWGGNDIIEGRGGNDSLTGGSGADHFVFTSTASGVDTITDFNQLDGGADEFDVLEFQGLRVGTFAYLGSGAFTGGSDNSEARVSGNQVLVDANGDGVADITITLTGLTNANQIGADDFLFT